MINIKNFVEELDLEVLNPGTEKELDIPTAYVSRPGLQLAGFFEYFESRRIQIIGKAETAYLNWHTAEERREKFERLMEHNIPCIIISHGLTPFPELIEVAQKYNTPVFKTNMVTTYFFQRLVEYLNVALAPTISKHGVFVDVYGIGVLITGESGIGKSETALELVKRGHRMVADDSVSISKVGEELVGEAPEKIKHLMEMRGIGIIDVMKMYGVGAVIDKKAVNLIVEMEFWDENKEYDRLGLERPTQEILGVSIPKITIPVRPGRNLAIIIEVAARNYRLKQMGINPAQELIDGLADTL